ncbi:tripartite tricarboxylate transporter TctB family protein [Serinicoccus kebangsaanensis]|uniref:tripartite tricarboxylate transporter TctB family protein n=1 Tax=Serinicoccus kebangsaanensis TaxID=2602069 RepID=UPI00192DF40D|nr:tripartite tricarboxylate transporter TctB family protein [Serinicoccus kebangsaanensis]
MARSTDLVSGAATVALGAAVLWAVSDFPVSAPVASDPALLPRLLGAGLIGCGALLVVVHLVRRRLGLVTADDVDSVPLDLPEEAEQAREAGRTAQAQAPAVDWGVVGGLSVAVTVYAVAAFQLGFIVSTFAFVSAASLILGRDRSRRSLLTLGIFAAAVATVAHLGFFELLSVRAPDTPLP